METKYKVIIGIFAFILVLSCTATGVTIYNEYKAELIEVNLDTNWEEQKKIEDTLRAYVSSYEADKITYETAGSNTELANAAKIRANRTAAEYNNFYLKNKHIWKDRVPEDIKNELLYIE